MVRIFSQARLSKREIKSVGNLEAIEMIDITKISVFVLRNVMTVKQDENSTYVFVSSLTFRNVETFCSRSFKGRRGQFIPYDLHFEQDSLYIYIHLEIHISRTTSFSKCPSLPYWFSGEARLKRPSSRFLPRDRKRQMHVGS